MCHKALIKKYCIIVSHKTSKGILAAKSQIAINTLVTILKVKLSHETLEGILTAKISE